MTKKYYTGVGARKTPPSILKMMKRIAHELEEMGYVLRSGGDWGADSAFERGVKRKHMVDIFLPWKGFNYSQSPLYFIPDRAFEIAATAHPVWKKCNSTIKRFHARNVQQVLGGDLTTPSDFTICWTPGGHKVGGTATAITLSEQYQVKVYNLAIREDRRDLVSMILMERSGNVIISEKGSLFDIASKVDAIVNPVNCQGVMGKGLALLFKEKYPINYQVYKQACKGGEVSIGSMHIFKPVEDKPFIINFPTKKEWKHPSKIEDIEEGLKHMKEVVKGLNIQSIAIPALGCGEGGLDFSQVRKLVKEYLGNVYGLRVHLFRPSRD